MFTPNGRSCHAEDECLHGHGESRVRHPLHGMSVPHTVRNECQNRTTQEHPERHWQESGCSGGKPSEAGSPTTQPVSVFRGQSRRKSKGSVVRDGSKERQDVILTKVPTVRAGGAKKQQGHRV